MVVDTQEKFPVKILLVDDKEGNLMALESILQDNGYIFRRARSGEEALRALLKETDYTLVIMDVIMPGMDGFQTASYIAQREKLMGIPIIFLTAKDRDDNIFRAYNLGAVDYISKPVVPDLLKAKVNVFVELSRKNKALEYQKEQLREINEKLALEVNERKASEEKVNRLNQELSIKLEELESLDSFSYSVSHDLKNPLASISMLMEILKMDYADKLDQDGVDLIMRAEKQVNRVVQIVHDLLLFSRYGREIEREEVDMNEIVKSVLDEIKLLYSIDHYQLQVAPLPTVKCDGSLIKQVWTNLISNAVKYAGKKEVPEVTIETCEQNGQVVYVVKDNGIGFDPKDMDKLFKVFSRWNLQKSMTAPAWGWPL